MRREVEDGIRQTRERIAGSSLRVNVFLGYHSNGNGKSLKIRAGTSAKRGAKRLDGRPGERLRRTRSEREKKSKAPHVDPTCGPPRFVSGFIVRATRPFGPPVGPLPIPASEDNVFDGDEHKGS